MASDHKLPEKRVRALFGRLDCARAFVDAAKTRALQLEVPAGVWRYRLTVRTDGSQPSNRGSIPRTATILRSLRASFGWQASFRWQEASKRHAKDVRRSGEAATVDHNDLRTSPTFSKRSRRSQLRLAGHPRCNIGHTARIPPNDAYEVRNQFAR